MRAPKTDEYKTKDFYISVCMLALGTQLLRLEKATEKITIFVFGIAPVKANEIIKNHWDRKLSLPTRNVVDAIHELKTRLYSGS